MKFSRAFTIIELIFVIIVLGILAAVALPRFQGAREQADIGVGKATIATIRAAIVNERQTRLILGDPDYITAANMDNASGLFGGVLTDGLTNPASATSGEWFNDVPGDGSYVYTVSTTDTVFTYYPTETTVGAVTYSAGTFTCVAGQGDCNRLVD